MSGHDHPKPGAIANADTAGATGTTVNARTTPTGAAAVAPPVQPMRFGPARYRPARFRLPRFRLPRYRPPAPAAAFAVLTGLIIVPTTAVAQSAVIEPRTGISFPASLTPPGGESSHWLAGMGVRERTFLRIRVYAFGLYVDRDGARAALQRFAGTAAAQLAEDEAFYDWLLELRFGMTLRLEMARNVPGADAAEAFDAALRPRVARATTDTAGAAGAADALPRFRGYLAQQPLTTGTELVFSCNPEGRMTTAIAGTAFAPIQSPALCWSLFDVYLGRDPISPAGRKTVIARFVELLEPAR